ncbi:hypothetical protein AB0G79_05905 [Streptomyces sp. NPDC020807]|uniref:hypothetical protein n=1 Tax=Streptomyces sp. NPDC020807 TaxID=3155119 RepID=UPI0034076EAB
MEAYVDGGGSYAMRGMSAAAVRYNAETMTDLKQGIDAIIDQLVASEADKGRVEADPVQRSQFGGGGAGWSEANGVYTSYSTVVGKLTELSGLLRDCLEGLSIAVVVSRDGFQEMDDDVKQKMINIHQRTDEAKTKADREAGRVPTSEGSQEAASEGDSAYS